MAVIDNLSTGFRFAIPDGVSFYQGDIADGVLLARIFAEQGIGAIMHFAGSVVVPESVEDPLKYYLNNTVRSRALIDAAVISDTVLDSIIQNAVIMDSLSITDEVIDKLDAMVLIIDGAVIEDSVISSGGAQGQAWTANVDSWAMSRYNPYNYNRLVVINGVLYGEADDGIYRLDQEVDAVTAIVKTGKMDLSGGQLTHPASAYLEYELNGGASMTVHSTQKGIEQQYTYILPSELANELTNGRFIFGRGLRGRHFAFELIMIGTHGHVNDLSIEHMPTSRRV